MTDINTAEYYDVAICGAGLAGLTLARQIKRTLPDCSVVLIDRLTRPLPPAAFKVGESTVEVGAHYLGAKLGLIDYFDRDHIVKLGLRFFYQNGSKAIQDRPEWGLAAFPKGNTYQIDRGRLEEDLRRMNVENGIHLIEGMSVQDVNLAEDESPHEVLLSSLDRQESRSLKAHWVVDATGRRRMLQKKLGLQRERSLRACSSAWFRFAGRVDIGDLVPREEAEWHARVPDGMRYHSTNHLMGPGYWVWLIPLSTGHTSVGIVTIEDVQPFDEYNTYPKAMQWLRSHEPVLAEYLEGREPQDFRVMRRYSYTSNQIFSPQRWACVGEAGVFADPFYSPGTDIIGFGNTITTEMIRLDRLGELTPERVTSYNQFLISYNDALTERIQLGYPFFGTAVVMGCKTVWDTAISWAFVCPQMFNSIYLDPEHLKQIRAVTASFFFLSKRMDQLLVDWAARAPGRLTFDFFNYLTLDVLRDLRQRNLQTNKSMAELIADHEKNMARMEELAQLIFLLAVEDVIPECLVHFPEPVWINAWVMSLKPERWEQEGLFRPKSEPRDLSAMREQIRSLFHLKEAVFA